MVDLSDGPCGVCNRLYPPWFTDDDTWNSLSPGRAWLLCPTCFVRHGDGALWEIRPARPLSRPAKAYRLVRHHYNTWRAKFFRG